MPKAEDHQKSLEDLLKTIRHKDRDNNGKGENPMITVDTSTDLCKMRLHTIAKDPKHFAEILRVVGGWIYMFPTGMVAFVPDPTRDTEK